MEKALHTEKPRQSLASLISISFGFLGIQFAFGLQNGNVSRIFQSLGSSVDDLPLLWLAGPVTGLLVQPLIGHYSDHHWSRFGRRRPFFFAGAFLAAIALFGFPHAGSLFMGAICLWILDASLNISMEPFRAFVGDMTRPDQRASGYAVQTVLIGIGAVLGSLAPWLFTKMGVSNTAPKGQIPDSVSYSLYLGGAAILLATLWTVLRVREYSPQEMAAFNKDEGNSTHSQTTNIPRNGIFWTAAGLAGLLAVWGWGLEKQLYVLAASVLGFGILQLVNQYASVGNTVRTILSDLSTMPVPMRHLAIVQFFSWIALFIMWTFTGPVVTQYVFGSTDTATKAFNDGSDWVGVLFAIYNGVAAIVPFVLPALIRKIGAAKTHALCLAVGALSYLGVMLIRDANLLILPMIGIGIVWASILMMPYVMLANTLPQNKLGIYMGIFNFFIVLPQMLTATIMGVVMRGLFPGDPKWTMLCAAVTMGVAAVFMFSGRKIVEG